MSYPLHSNTMLFVFPVSLDTHPIIFRHQFICILLHRDLHRRSYESALR